MGPRRVKESQRAPKRGIERAKESPRESKRVRKSQRAKESQ